MRKLQFIVLLATALFVSACSSGGSDSPSDSNVHPTSWFSTHAVEATANPGYGECRTCHGLDLTGNGDAVSCYSCHSYNTEPPFSTHPPSWTDTYVDHRADAATNGTDSCTACHGPTLQGYQTAPSCFSESFDGQRCHPDGPGEAPHPLDGSYLLGTNHGPDAKSDLTVCQACHGQPGGPGSNPRFNLGIIAAGDQGCESCHGVDYAHPQDGWAGPDGTFHYSAGNVQNACSLCHGVSLDGVGGVGSSCLECHAETTTFTLDCTSCHGTPPDGSADLDVPIPVPHGNVSLVSLHDVCETCHGMKESTAGGSFSADPNYTLFNYSTDRNGDHWNGNIEMNAVPQYNINNFGCDAAGCHGNDPAHQLSDSGLPVNLKDFGAAVPVPHPVDGTYLNGSAHGPDARADLTACQACHGQPGGPGTNPRFNIGIASAGGTGCEACHTLNYAHPPNWAGPNDTFHYQPGNIPNACTLCHGVDLDGNGGVGVSCLSCHAETTNFTLNCTACHGYPPIGPTEIADIPIPVDHRNTAIIGSHDVCAVCHGVKESSPTGGSFETNTNYLSFNRATNTNGDHWDGTIDMNLATQYNESNFGCDAAGCHGNDPAHQLSDSGITVELKDFGSGGGTAPHATDGTFLNPANHGPAAKGLTAAFPEGMLDCQPCHAQSGGPGSNPRFNVGINSAGGVGCEGCHNIDTAHPAGGAPDAQLWYNNAAYIHSDVTAFNMCTLCHGAAYEGGSGPACTSCHNVSPVSNPTGCVSCHNQPPDDDLLVGPNRPNNRGRHFTGPHESYPCARCHSGFGANTADHYDTSAPADVLFSSGGTYDSTTSRCSDVSCHGSGSPGTWY